MNDSKTATQGKPSFADTVNSFTGHEEVAIREQFGMAFAALFDTSAAMARRAAVFILARRDGEKNRGAFNICMDMTLAEVSDYFQSDEDDEDDPVADDPATDQGKDDSASA